MLKHKTSRKKNKEKFSGSTARQRILRLDT